MFLAPQFVGNEFGHIHPEYDGSLHVMVNPDMAVKIAASGWGELHPRTDKVVMVYGPRDPDEVETVFAIVEAAYRYSLGEEDGQATPG